MTNTPETPLTFEDLDHMDQVSVRASACMVLATMADVMERDHEVIDATGLRETAARIGQLDLTEVLSQPDVFDRMPTRDLSEPVKADVAKVFVVLANTMDREAIPYIGGGVIGHVAKDAMEVITMVAMIECMGDAAGPVLDMINALSGHDDDVQGPGPEPGSDAMAATFEEIEAEISAIRRTFGL